MSRRHPPRPPFHVNLFEAIGLKDRPRRRISLQACVGERVRRHEFAVTAGETIVSIRV